MATRGKWGAKKELELQDQNLRDRLEAHMAVKHWTRERMAQELGMSKSTFDRRMKKPREFTLCELRRVVGVLGWGYGNVYDRLFGNWEVQ